MAQITLQRRGEYLKAVLNVLVDKGGFSPAREAIAEAEKRLNLVGFEKELTPKNQNERWWAILQLHSIDLVKAGWLRKHKAVWYITDEGREALKMEPENFLREAIRLYREWKRNAKPEESAEEEIRSDETEPLAYEQSQATAREEIKNYILNLNPYDFQDLVAALFRGMGYYTPFVAPKGPDGGVDIIAYKDPLGAESPRIRVQVKHHANAVGSPDVQNLLGALQGDGNIGVFVSTGGFSKDAIATMRNARIHVDKIDLERFIDLWEEHYDKMSEEDQAYLPIRRIAFLAPEE